MVEGECDLSKYVSLLPPKRNPNGGHVWDLLISSFLARLFEGKNTTLTKSYSLSSIISG